MTRYTLVEAAACAWLEEHEEIESIEVLGREHYEDQGTVSQLIDKG